MVRYGHYTMKLSPNKNGRQTKMVSKGFENPDIPGTLEPQILFLNSPQVEGFSSPAAGKSQDFNSWGRGF